MARDSLYSNSPYSSRTGEAWIYQDGELYHYGRPGMKWGKTIFGGIDNPKSLTYDPNYGKGRFLFNQNRIIKPTQRQRAINKLSTRPGAVGRGVRGSIGSNTRGNVINDAKNFGGWVFDKARKLGENVARDGWVGNQINFNTYKSTGDMNKRVSDSPYIWSTRGMSHLETNMAKQIEEGQEAYDAMREDGSIKNILNLAIQNAQYNVVSGLNNVLTKLGLDDEVDRWLSKWIGNSDWQARDKAAQRIIDYNETRDPGSPVSVMFDGPYEYKDSDPGHSPYTPTTPTGRKRPSASAAERIADRIPINSGEEQDSNTNTPLRNPNVRKHRRRH